MELKPPKFELEIEKITILQNTFWLELKNLGTGYLYLIPCSKTKTKWPKFKSYFVCKMELKPPKFELEIEKITILQNTFWLELKNLGTGYLSLYLIPCSKNLPTP